MLFRPRCYSALCAFLLLACFQFDAQTTKDIEPVKPSSLDSLGPVKVTTRLVVVDVVAHDKKGAAILDLQPAELRLVEDGREQAISSFNLFRSPKESSVANDQRFVPEDLPADHFGNAPTFSNDAALNVVLLDSLNSNLSNQAYVRTEMIKFLKKLPEGQPVAIFTLGKKLRLLQDFTTDQSALKKVIDVFRGEAPQLSQNPAGTVQNTGAPTGIIEQILKEKAPDALNQINDFVEQTVSDQNDLRIQHTFTALTAVANILSRYHGRKNLFWISESIPMNIFSDFNTINRPYGGTAGASQASLGGKKRQVGYAEDFARLANLFADAQIAVYPVDARGLIGSPLYNVADNIGASGGGAGLGGMSMKAEGRQAEELFQAHVSMLDIADKTGGKAFYNRNDIDNSLTEGINDGATYYSLGYYPANKHWDGKFRKIEVKTQRAGVRLRYRTGYFALERKPYADEDPSMRDAAFAQALNTDSPVNTSLQFRAAFVSENSAGQMVLRYTIDPHAITFAADAVGNQRAEVDCAARVYLATNVDKPLKTEATKVNAVLAPEVYQKILKTHFPCEVKIDLAPGRYLVRLGVRDNAAGRIGTANASMVVPVQGTTTAKHP